MDPQATAKSRKAPHRKAPKRNATFIEPMECALATQLPDGPHWLYEIKLDGYRAIGVKSSRAVNLYSRRRKTFNAQFPDIVDALGDLPSNTVVDGEIVALNEFGHPDFHALQSFRSNAGNIGYFVFDLLVYKGRDLTLMPLQE